MSGHTATPWAVDPDHRPGMGWNAHVVEAANPDNRVCFMTSGPEGKINAAFIVTACNAHADLTREVEQLRAWQRARLEQDDAVRAEHDALSNSHADLVKALEEIVLKGKTSWGRDSLVRLAEEALATLTARKVG